MRAVVLLFPFILSGCGDPPSQRDDLRIDPTDRQQIAVGAKVYSQHCAVCHGTRLEGQPNWRERLPSGRMPAPPHDETGHTWHHTDAVLFGITKHGLAGYAPPGYESDMPAFAGVLSDGEIQAVLAYIESHWKSRELLEARAEMLRNARRK
jgi:mono/diheme cytochrome c family protein